MSLFFEVSSTSLNKHDEELCGDKVEVAYQDKGVFVVLADGLGSGVKANILASITSKIVITMLAQGADVFDVVETMALTLPVCRERQIAYSTFTFLHINSDGKARLIEFDNPPSVVLRGDSIVNLERIEHSFINKKIFESQFTLIPGDKVVMFSDGVVHAGIGHTLNLGWQHKNVVEYLRSINKKDSSAVDIKTNLIEMCNNLYMYSPGDDTTVAVCNAKLPNVAYIMVGPPISSQNDEVVVHELLNCNGTKVVCGGTTSQIVSRVTGKKLKTNLNYISPTVPPIGEIDGIDLVTEGIITLGKALYIMEQYLEDVNKGSKLFSKNKSGADLLAEILLLKCTSAKFLVGRALNPAHQNPDMPINLNIKLGLVNDIIACLKKMNKEVSVVFY